MCHTENVVSATNNLLIRVRLLRLTGMDIDA